MKNHKKRERKLMRARNRDRINRNKKQQIEWSPLFILMLITLDLRGLSAGQVLERLRFHILMLNGNPNFPSTNPTVAVLQAKADELQLDIAKAKTGDHLLIEHRDTVQGEAEDLIRSLALDIEQQSGKNKEKAHSAGFKTRKEKSPPVKPGTVIVMYAKPVGEGKIKLRWKKIPNAGVYIIESFNLLGGPPPIPLTNTPVGKWELFDKSFITSIEFKGLTPGQMYYFRVYAINQVGQGDPSDIADQRSL